jgi:transcriptional regulator of arginine metabolism
VNLVKNTRQSAILGIIEKQDVQTQEELAGMLKDLGISVTQATVSRDIKELRLLKILSADGGYKYATADKAEHSVSDRFVRMFVDSVLSITYAGNIIVIKTLSGSANVAGEAIDSMRWPEILGTLSGDNTIMVVVRGMEDAPAVVAKFQEILN